MAYCKSLKLLGFVSRISQEFCLLTPLESLYFSLIHPILELSLSSLILTHLSLETRSSWFRGSSSTWSLSDIKFFAPPHDHILVLTALSISSIANRRYRSNLLFLSKLLSNQIDSYSLLSVINFRVPLHHIRSFDPFHVPQLTSNFLLNSYGPLSLFCVHRSFLYYMLFFCIF